MARLLARGILAGGMIAVRTFAVLALAGRALVATAAASEHAALLEGAEVTGVSIMLIDEGMDTGPLLAQQEEPLRAADTTASLSARLAGLGANLLIDVLPRWLAGRIMPLPQDPAQASLTRLIKKEDGALDWRLPAVELWRRVRAYTPWPGASTTLDGVPLRLLQSWPIDRESGAEPGRVLLFKEAIALPAGLPRPSFAVQTGRGLLLPLILQKAGKRPLAAADFANGERGLLGKRLGA